MTRRVLLTGFGGQGVVLAGHILGKAAAIYDGREATLIQAYGPEARGGATLVQVTISNEPILYPYIDSADAVVCMSQEGFSKYAPALRPGGALLIEEDLVRLPDGHPVPGILLSLARMIPTQGITARSDKATMTFGAGLPDAELAYIHALIVKTLTE